MKTLINFVRAFAWEQALMSAAGAFALLLLLGAGLWVLDLGDIALGLLAMLSGWVHTAYAFAGWTLFAFAPLAILLAMLTGKRLSQGLASFDRHLIGLIEVCGYGVGLLGTLHNLKQAAQGAGLTFQSAMSAFNPLEIGIGLWILCQLVGWNFGTSESLAIKQEAEQSGATTDLTAGDGNAMAQNPVFAGESVVVESANIAAGAYDEKQSQV